ncbi:MAG: type II toxin-antitoxin system VapC family toxin [bacterium]|nr:type II toxin-antitoxin system VapC family toxin [bacterium]
MTVYFDSSAVVALLIEEPGSTRAHEVWRASDTITTSELTFVEVAAGLAQAERMRRLRSADYEAAWEQFTRLWEVFTVIGVGHELVRRAAGLARSHALRGFDAIQCASALAVSDTSSIAVTGDRRLLAAWRELGMHTVDTSASG